MQTNMNFYSEPLIVVPNKVVIAPDFCHKNSDVWQKGAKPRSYFDLRL